MVIRDIPVEERKDIRAAIPRIQFAARLALRRSAKAVQESHKASSDKLVRERVRAAIIIDTSKDLSVCALHATGHHDGCRPEVCPQAEVKAISPDILKAFEKVKGYFSIETVTQVVGALCDHFPDLEPKKHAIIYAARETLRRQSVVTVTMLHHAYGNHKGCSVTCSQRPIKMCELAKKELVKETSFLVAKVERLLENLDSNVAESYGAMLHQFSDGRRTNLQGRGAGIRQATLAGLTMARGYAFHRAVQQDLGFLPSNVLDCYAQHVAKRRKKAKENATKRRRTQNLQFQARPSAYNKETAKDAFNDISDRAMGVLVAQRLARIEQVDLKMAEAMVNLGTTGFMDALGDRMLSENIAELCQRKDLMVTNKTLMNKLLKTVNLVPWHVTEGSKEKAVVEQVRKGKIKMCGLFICPTNKIFASKPDGILVSNSKNAVFRILKGYHSDKWIEALAQVDLVCSDMDKAVFMVNNYLVEFERDNELAEKMEEVRVFFTKHVLPAIIKRENGVE
jgi:hypothetical protein